MVEVCPNSYELGLARWYMRPRYIALILAGLAIAIGWLPQVRLQMFW